MESTVTSIISLIIMFLMVGIPTFFITRKYGRNLKRDWLLWLIPTGIFTPIIMSTGLGTGEGIAYDMGSILAESLIIGIIAYFVCRRKKKLVN